MLYRSFLLSFLALLASAVPSSAVAAPNAPTVANLGPVSNSEQPFASLTSVNGAGLRTIFRSPSPNEISHAIDERSADAATDLTKRTIYGPICSGGHTPPSRDDCVRVIQQWSAFHQSRSLAANGCDEVVYGSCLGYICATRCNSITYNTDYVAQKLQAINSACVINNGEAGYFHSTGGTNPDGTGYARFEIGLERYSGELPPYEPCA